MPLVVFLRGVNVGGHKAFRPSLLAKDLAKFRVVSVGAAGTFVVHADIDPKALRAEILRKLPFEVEVMICPAAELLRLVRGNPFGNKPPEKDVRRFVSVLAGPPRTRPRLPVDVPDKDGWAVRLIKVTGSFALSVQRKSARTRVYPNEVVEKTLGVPATTRAWNTIVSICAALQEG